MKNIYLRLAVIGGVVALGAAAIGQSMMASRKSDPEPIEISQIPETTGETAPAPTTFPPSQVVLAAGEAPAAASSPIADDGETTQTQPSADPSQPPSARFRFQSGSSPTAATDTASNPAAANDGSSPPSRFSRFLSSSGGSSSAAEDDSAENPASAQTTNAATAAQGTPTPAVSRFGAPTSSGENPANPAASPAGPMPPSPQRFSLSDGDDNAPENSASSSAATADTSKPTGMDQPPVRFRMADEPTAAVADAASQIAADADQVVQETAETVRGAVEDAGTRFSSMADSARQNLTDEVSRRMDAAGNALSQGMPSQPMTRFQSGPTPAGGDNPAATSASSENRAAMANSTNGLAPTGSDRGSDGATGMPSSAAAESADAAREGLTSATPTPAQPSSSSQPPASFHSPTPSVMGSAQAYGPGVSPNADSASAPAASLGSAPISSSPPGPSYGASPRYGAAASEMPSGGYGAPATTADMNNRQNSGGSAGVPGMLVSARPGDARLEGDQTPSIRLEKIAPPEVQVGKVTTFELHVENISRVQASNVVVRDMVPAGTKLVSTTPQADQGSDGSLVWQLGTLAPQERKNLKLEILPLEEGDIGSVASVSFAATASAKSVVTRPKLLLEQSGSARVLAGQQLGITITLSNPGTGAATGVVLEENVPSGFSHPAGRELEFEVGTLKPGESRQLELVLNAESAGQTQNLLRARADGNLTAEDALPLEVIAPKLQVAMSGPKMRYLDRPATYTVSISNPGTAPANDIDVVTYLPKGLKFVEANNAGQYDATRHAIFWSLEQLPPSQTGNVELVALPIEPGDQRLRVETTADTGLTAQHESTIRVEGLAAIFFEVVDLADPIEVGGESTYEIKVVNQGSKDATNVQVAAQLPQGLKALAADGDAKGQINGQQVAYQAIPRIGPKQSAKLTLKVQGTAAGDQRLRVQVSTDGIPDPITKEESTTVYSDK